MSYGMRSSSLQKEKEQTNEHSRLGAASSPSISAVVRTLESNVSLSLLRDLRNVHSLPVQVRVNPLIWMCLGSAGFRNGGGGHGWGAAPAKKNPPLRQNTSKKAAQSPEPALVWSRSHTASSSAGDPVRILRGRDFRWEMLTAHHEQASPRPSDT